MIVEVDPEIMSCVPHRLGTWQAGGDGMVVVERPKPETRGLGAVVDNLSWLMSHPKNRLDELGIDRRRAADLGVDFQGLAATLRAMIDGDELIDLNIDDEAVPILLESASGDINDPSDLVNLYVSAEDGGLVPLSSVVTLKEEGVATELNRQAQRRAIEIDATLSPEVTMREEEVLEGQENLVEVRNSLREIERQRVITQGLSTRLLAMLREIEEELAKGARVLDLPSLFPETFSFTLSNPSEDAVVTTPVGLFNR